MRIASLSRPGRLAQLATGLTFLALFSATSLAAQDSNAQGGKAEATTSSDASIRSAIDKLASPDFDVRRAAGDELVARGKQAVEALEKVVADSKDPELRWQARRVLRRIDRADSGQRRSAEQPGGDELRSRGRQQDERQLERVERGQQARPQPRQDWSDFDPGFPGLDPDFAERIRKQIEEALPRGFGLRFGPGGPGGQGAARGSSLKVEVGPNGVEVEEKANENGKETVKRYSAKDMESLLEKHPELKGRIGVTPRIDIDMPDFGSFFGGTPFRGFRFDRAPLRGFEQDLGALEQRMRELEERLRQGGMGAWRRPSTDQGRDKSDGDKSDGERRDPGLESTKPQPAAPDGPTLGVMIRESIPASLRDYLDLEDGVGLWVESVVDASLAAKAGVLSGDILVAIDGAPLRSPSDVRNALSKKGSAKLSLEIVRKGASKTLTIER